MNLIEDIGKFVAPSHSVVTSGMFDGVHVGHRKILSRIVEMAREDGGASVVLTFWPHPRFVLKKDHEALKLLSTFEEKVHLLSELGIDYLVKIPFTREFSDKTSEDFIQEVLISALNTKKLVIGYNHRFGKNREGGFDYLSSHAGEYGFDVQEIPRQEIDHLGVSSSRIREALAAGDVLESNELLGRMYSLTGFVKDGDRIGRSIGFPTANIDVPESYKLIPSDGSYAVFVEWKKNRYQGMLNIGWRPTVSGQERRIEVNIFNFDADIYNERLTLHFVKQLRKERKFGSMEELKLQLSKDRSDATYILNEIR